MKNRLLRTLFGLVGFVIFTALAAGVIFLLLYAVTELFETRIRPRGMGFIAVPILSGVAGFKLFYEYEIIIDFVSQFTPINLQSRTGRMSVALASSWTLMSLLYLIVANPRSHSLTKRVFDYDGSLDSHFIKGLEVIFVPAVIILIAIPLAARAYSWVLKAERDV